MLASATVASLEEQQGLSTASLLSSAEGAVGAAAATAAIAAGWAAVFESGGHEILEVRAEGKSLEALKLLLTTNSVVSTQLPCPWPGNPRCPAPENPQRRTARSSFSPLQVACWCAASKHILGKPQDHQQIP